MLRRAVPHETGSGQREKPLADPESEFNRGIRLEEAGDTVAAEVAYRVADSFGHVAAACNLGVLLEQQRRIADAEAAYRRAETRGDAGAAFNLGALLEERGDLVAAEAAYRRADARGHGAAASNLGILLEERGDLAGAESAFRRAAARGNTHGGFNLAALLKQHRGGPADPPLAAEAAEIRKQPGNEGPSEAAGATPGLRGLMRGRKRLLLAIGMALIAAGVAVTLIATRPPTMASLAASAGQRSADPQPVPASSGPGARLPSRPHVVSPEPAAEAKLTLRARAKATRKVRHSPRPGRRSGRPVVGPRVSHPGAQVRVTAINRRAVTVGTVGVGAPRAPTAGRSTAPSGGEGGRQSSREPTSGPAGRPGGGTGGGAGGGAGSEVGGTGGNPGRGSTSSGPGGRTGAPRTTGGGKRSGISSGGG